MLARKRREMRKWAETNKKNKGLGATSSKV